MKVVIAPDSFKGSLDAPAVAKHIAAGLQQSLPKAELLCLPVADGGEGTTAALVEATQGQMFEQEVSDPLGEPMLANWGCLGGSDSSTAVIEVAAASGIDKISAEQRDVLRATSRGTGELILQALDHGIREFVIGLGGSACNDAGAGLLSALGLRLLDADGVPLMDGGAALADLHSIDVSQLDSRLQQCQFRVACDVNNPLLGETGASAVFGPQKGATPEMVQQLDSALAHFADVCERTTGIVSRNNAGAGAAGGVGFGLMQFLNCEFEPGIELILEAIDFASHLQQADWVITGEGKLDEQSQYGKAPMGVAQMANAAAVPVIAFAGSMTATPEQLNIMGIKAAYAITPEGMPLAEAMASAATNLQHTASQVGRLLGSDSACPASIASALGNQSDPAKLSSLPI